MSWIGCFRRTAKNRRKENTESQMNSKCEFSPLDQCNRSGLYHAIPDHQWPIIYSPEYNLSVLGLEKLHPFDAGKWGNVFDKLRENGMVNSENIVEPPEATEKDLLVIHTPRYLQSLQSSLTVARITEVAAAALLPNCVIEQKFLRPMRLQTGGSVLAGKLALDRGWAINIGGDSGGGFCSYADISLCIEFLFLTGAISKAMIVDLDAHQGNGHERDFIGDGRVYILDMFNAGIYPHDEPAKKGIRRKVELKSGTTDAEYLDKLQKNLSEALKEFSPELIVFNAGTDVLRGDPLGNLDISPEGVIRRDEIVFQAAKENAIPIVMLTSGGYQHQSAPVIAESILNLWRKKLIMLTPSQIVREKLT